MLTPATAAGGGRRRSHHYRGGVRNGTHVLVGVTAALGAAQALGSDVATAAGMSVGAVVGSALPDADQLGSRVHRRTRMERRNILIGAVGLAVRIPLVAFAVLARHRGVSHSLLACAALTIAAAGVVVTLPAPAPVLAGGLVLGYAAHVLADGCTPHGVELWAPLSRRRVRFVPRGAHIPTGSVRERLLAVITFLAATMLVWTVS